MREILFRCKRTDKGKWVEGYYCPKPYSHFPCEPTIFPFETINKDWHGERVDPETVCQFTGLCDKNGRKIFEGDIVRCYYSDISPFTDEIEPYEKEVLIDDIRRSQVIGWIDCADELEIIGNIYDNPELLEVKQNR